MTELTIVRHGQANTGATNEASYDRLSDLGHQQARWLGEYLGQIQPFERVISGTMRRQIETAEGLNQSALPHSHDARLNELDYFGLAQSLRDDHGVAIPDNAHDFVAHVPMVLEAWRVGNLCGNLESYDSFRARILAGLAAAAELPGRTLLVSSTGVIATLTAMALGLDTAMKTKMFLSVANTSVHKFELRRSGLYLTQFGSTPHLDHPARLENKTFA